MDVSSGSHEAVTGNSMGIAVICRIVSEYAKSPAHVTQLGFSWFIVF